MTYPTGRSLLVALAVLGLSTVWLSACDDPVAPSSEPQDRILFVREDATGGDIYAMNVDGSGVENLTDHPAAYTGLRLSPDGTRVAFYSDRGGCYDVWTMRTDGTEPTRLTGVAGDERCNYAPEWSPDGRRIAFYTSRNVTEGRGWDAYVMDADGGGVVDVGNNPATEPETHDDYVHGWSPDGRVVLLSHRDGRARTWLVDPDGTDIEPFLDGFTYPYWSPDGGELLCHREGDDGDIDLEIRSGDGSGGFMIAAGPSWDQASRWAPTPWSPDGTRLAFHSSRDGDLEIYVVVPDGSGLTNVTNDPSWDAFLGWSPDGTRFLFASERTGDKELYVANADGSGVVRLTDHPGDDWHAVWVPR